jgi:diadenosine tetraphosphate (Ap4A) HIT family hydrolase
MPDSESRTPSAELVLPVFGRIEPERIVAQDDLFAVVRDKYPITAGHTLIVPKRPVQRLRELTADERSRLMEWTVRVQTQLMEADESSVEDFNIGLNDGPAAGQTMRQLHLHVIPRRLGDVPDPRGGVRWVIPERARYW